MVSLGEYFEQNKFQIEIMTVDRNLISIFLYKDYHRTISNQMTSLEKLRKSLRFGDIELGLGSIHSPRSKQSGTTGYSPCNSIDDNVAEKVGITTQEKEVPSHPGYSVDDLKLKLLKMRQYKSAMDLKFKNHISVLQSQIAAIEQQNVLLKKLSSTVKKDVQQIKTDLNILKNCIAYRQSISSLYPQSSNLQKQPKMTQRQNTRSKPSRLFKPHPVKCK